jgi:RNA polymerase sigma factor (sigma-70 family)
MDQADLTSSFYIHAESLECSGIDNQSVTDAWEVFNREFSGLLHPHSPFGTRTFAFVRRCLFQFHMHAYFNESYVLNEVYIRAHRQIVYKAAFIHNIPMWVRTTAYNVIRELSRQQKRQTHLEVDESVPNKQDFAKVAHEELEEDLIRLHVALNRLDSEDRRLLELKIIQNMTWQEIHELFKHEKKEIDVASLRKRKERAIARLRRIYHQVSEEEVNLKTFPCY